MTSVLDASFPILLFDPHANAPLDPMTGRPVTHCADRIRHFLDQRARPRGARIVIPTLALAEFLLRTRPESVGQYLSQLQRIRGCDVVPFSVKAATEFAEMQRTLLPERKRSAPSDTRGKAKFDQQIVAIARAEGASTIYSDDANLARYALRFKIETIGVGQLPPAAAQLRMSFLSLPTPTPDDTERTSGVTPTSR